MGMMENRENHLISGKAHRPLVVSSNYMTAKWPLNVSVFRVGFEKHGKGRILS